MRVDVVTGMGNELRLAIRRLVSSPSFTATAVLTLALGIGANTAIFSVVDAVLLRPLPYPESDRLVAVEMVPRRASGEPGTPWPWTYPRFELVREHMRSFAAIAAFDAYAVSISGGGSAERLQHETVSASYFEILGAQSQRGRLFSAADDDAANPQAVAIISHALWLRRFGGDTDIIGSTIRLNDIAFTVIGVVPPAFRGMAPGTEVWTPMAMAPAVHALETRLTDPRMMWHQVMARLRPDVHVASATAELIAVRQQVEERYPSPSSMTIDLRLRPLLDATIDPTLRRSLWVLFAAVAFVLLITAANVSNLLLTRATSYRRQLAIRRALGASRSALARITIAEALVVAIVGGAIGMLLAFWGTELLTSLRPERVDGFWSAYARVVDAETVEITAAVFAFNFGIALLSGLAFATLPALHVTRIEITDALRGRSGSAMRRGPMDKLGRSLIVLQMATATVLATGAGVMVQSFARMLTTDLGARDDHLLTFRVDLPGSRFDEERARALQQTLETRLAALPGVASVALANSLPVSGQMEATAAAPAPEDPSTGIGVHMVSADFFRTLAIRVLNGRGFTPAEYASAAHVGVINETAARAFFPDGNAIGRRLNHAAGMAREVEVIGVVADVRYNAVEEAAGPDLYLTNTVFPPGSFYVVLRTRSDARTLFAAAQRALHEIDPSLPAFDVRTMQERVGLALSRPRFVTAVLGIFALIAFAIAGIGVYGVVSHTVGARVREIAIRMALGARQNRVLTHILLESAIVSFAALIIGVPAALASTRVLASMLYGVTPHDAATIAAVAFLVVATALVATWQPARRAARTDPMAVLRHD